MPTLAVAAAPVENVASAADANRAEVEAPSAPPGGGTDGCSTRSSPSCTVGSFKPDPEEDADRSCSSTVESWPGTDIDEARGSLDADGDVEGAASAEAETSCWRAAVVGVFPMEAAGVGGDVTMRGEDGDGERYECCCCCCCCPCCSWRWLTILDDASARRPLDGTVAVVLRAKPLRSSAEGVVDVRRSR